MDHLNINPRILNAVRLAKIKLNDYDKILCTSVPELERDTKLKASDVVTLQSAVAASLVGLEHVTALDCYNNKIPRLTTGCKILDTFLRGGLLARGLTEVSGESGSGKTQLSLQLALCVQLPVSSGGLNAGAVYICTECGFPNKRLQQMITARSNIFSPQSGDKIFIEHVAEKVDLFTCVEKKLPKLLATGLVKLVVIDSVAALFRVDGISGTFSRSQQLAKLSKTLHDLSWKYGVVIVCVNQVTSNIGGNSGNNLIPALGLSWANSVTTRLILRRTGQEIAIQQESLCGEVVDRLNVVVRLMEVAFSPHLPKTMCKYIIDPEGVKGIV